MIWLRITANVLLWPVIHIAIAAIALRLPLALFTSSRRARLPLPLLSAEVRFYRKALRIQRWKSALPDGAPWLGGSSKRRLSGRDPAYLAAFIAETRRAEVAHWAMFACCPVLFLWNPPWACAVMFLYAAGSNLPCIVAQRYNRIVLTSVLVRSLAKLDSKPTAASHTTLLRANHLT